MHKATFTAEKLSGEYIGYTAEGIAPCFEIAEAIQIIQAHNKVDRCQIYYSEEKDSFWQANVKEGKLYTWKGRNYKTSEGVKHLYAIGELRLEVI